MLRDFRFASTPLGQDVRTLVDEGHVSKMSVAFMDAVREIDEKDGLPHVRKAELLNAAIVAIPANREASILAAKAAIALTDHSKSPVLTEDDVPADTDPEETAAPAAVTPPAEVDVARALTELVLVEADLALE
jgi:hypothetical protein